MAKIAVLQDNPEALKKVLEMGMYNYYSLPFVADLLTAYADLPNLRHWSYSRLRSGFGRVSKHPRFDAVWRKAKLTGSILPGKLRKYDLEDSEGRPVTLRVPKDEFYVLNFYDSTQPRSRQDHQIIAKSMAADSVFVGANLISISEEKNRDSWQGYVREGAYSWPHYHEEVASKRRLASKMAFYPAGTYVLINDDNLIEGVYDSVVKIAAALKWRQELAGTGLLDREKKILADYVNRFNTPK